MGSIAQYDFRQDYDITMVIITTKTINYNNKAKYNVRILALEIWWRSPTNIILNKAVFMIIHNYFQLSREYSSFYDVSTLPIRQY